MYDPYHTAFPKSAPKLKEKESYQHGALSETATLLYVLVLHRSTGK